MFFTVSLVASLVFAQYNFDFQVGYKYDYLFNSSSTFRHAQTSTVKDNISQNTFLTAIASIFCKNAVESGFEFELHLSQVHITQHDFDGKIVFEDDSSILQEKFAKYFKFSLQKDGSVHDVFAAVDENESVLSIKSGIIGQFILSDETADNQGLFSSSFNKVEKDNEITLSRTYTEKHFKAFHEDIIDIENVALESSESKIIQNNLPSTVVAASVVYFSGEKTNSSSSISSKSVVSLKLKGYEKSSTLVYFGNLQAIKFFDRDSYLNRPKVNTPHKHNAVGDDNCPSSLDLCKGYANSWTWGSSDFNVFSSVAAFAGVNSQCPAPSRNFEANTTLALGLTVLGRAITVGNLTGVYGYIDNTAQRNSVEFRAIGLPEPIFEWSIPDVLCNQGTYDIGSYQVPIPPLEYTFYVLGIIPVTFEIGVNVTISAEVDYGFCDANTSASLALVPTLTATPYAQAWSEIVVVRGGITLAVEDVNTLNPTLAVDGARCAVDASAYLDLKADVDFYGWYQYYEIFSGWQDKTYFDIYHDTFLDADLELFNYEWSISSAA